MSGSSAASLVKHPCVPRRPLAAVVPSEAKNRSWFIDRWLDEDRLPPDRRRPGAELRIRHLPRSYQVFEPVDDPTRQERLDRAAQARRNGLGLLLPGLLLAALGGWQWWRLESRIMIRFGRPAE